MCITEDKLVESYGKASPHERFRLIYKNYSIFPQLVDCYETGLFNRILFEVEYNRRKKNDDDDLGVRIQTGHRSDPTAAKAIEHIMIPSSVIIQLARILHTSPNYILLGEVKEEGWMEEMYELMENIKSPEMRRLALKQLRCVAEV